MSKVAMHISEDSTEAATPGPPTNSLSDRDKRRGRTFVLVALLLIVTGCLLMLGVAWVKYDRVRTCLDSGLARMRFMRDLVPDQMSTSAGLTLREADTQLRGLHDDLVCLKAEVREFLPVLPLLGWLPRVGPDIASAPVLLQMAEALADGGLLVMDALAPVIAQIQPVASSAPDAGEQKLDLPEGLKTLAASHTSLAEADAKLQLAAELQASLDESALSPRTAQLLALTERYLPLLRTGVRFARIAPDLLGVQEPGTYLILAQNDDERRPTGGWISGLGLVTISQGQVVEMDFRDSWAVDNPAVPHDTPPDSMLRALWAELWFFRDANWSPDFPTSAQVAEHILATDQGITVDGVIAVDQRALQLLVAAMEPITVDSSEEPITGANVLSFIRDSWTEPQEGVTWAESWTEWATHRKDFMADLVGAMVDRAQSQPQSVDLAKLADAVWRGLNERHILVYLHDAGAAGLLASQGWDGALVETQGDYLQVVDANVGFNKVNPNVHQTIDYRVDLSDLAQAKAEVRVRYDNRSQRTVESCLQEVEWMTSYQERMHGCYWDYVRFYVPEGSRLLTSERESLPPGSLLDRYRFASPGDAGPSIGPVERGKVPFGLFLVLAPGEQRDVHLAWQLPQGIIQKEGDTWRYRLLVQKQAGAPAIPLRVTVGLPSGVQLTAAQPEPFSVQGDVLTFELSLETDQHVEIMFREHRASQP